MTRARLVVATLAAVLAAWPAAASADPLGVFTPFSGSVDTVFARLDPLTLQPHDPQVRLGEYHDTWSLSPDGTRAAFGISAPGATLRIGIRIVDVASVQTTKDVETGIAAEAVAWASNDRIIAVLQSGDVVLVDADSGAIVKHRLIPPALECPITTPRGVALVTVIRGKPVFVLMGPQGRVQRVGLPRTRLAGGRCGATGLAVEGRRAFVVAPGSPLTEIDLRTMRLRYHRIAGTGIELLPRGRLAVFGSGVQVVDTDRWTTKQIDDSGSAALFTAGRLLVSGGSGGLRAYRLSGRGLFSVLRRVEIDDVQAAGRYAYARSDGGMRVVEVRSGRVVRTVPGFLAEVDLIVP